MDLNEQGHVNACCKAKDVLGFWSKEKISSIWNNEPIKNLRSAFLNGSKPRGCKSCWEEESRGLQSRRQDYNTKFKSDVDQIYKDFSVNKDEHLLLRPLQFQGLDIGFSAQCTLKCRMCGPSASSSWLSKALENKDVYKYYAELGELNPRVLETNFKDFLTDELFDDFCEKVAPKVSDLMINGGEPLASRHHYLFFSRMKEEDLARLKVSLTTNAQTTSFKEDSLVQYWTKLRIFNYRVSIDHVGDKYSYIRGHASLEKLQRSVQAVREGFLHDPGKLRIIFTTALSLYNITDLPSIIKFSITQGATHHFNWVHFPSFLSIVQTPLPLAKSIIEQLKQFLQQLENLPEWQQHPLWSSNFNLDKESNFLKSTLAADGWAEPQTYKDYAIFRIQIQINEIVTFLEKNCDAECLSESFKHHIAMMDKLFQTDFKKIYPEYLPYI